MFVNYLDKLKLLTVDELISNFKESLNFFKYYHKDINSHSYYKMEAIIQLLNIKYLSRSESKEVDELIYALDEITPIKCRCDVFNSYECIGTDVFKFVNDKDEPVHIYGQFIKKIFRLWQRERPIMHFENYLKKYVTEDIIESVKSKKDGVIHFDFSESKNYLVDFDSKKSIYWIEEQKRLPAKRYMFVLDLECKNLYVGNKKKGTFQHTSFLQGAPVACAGFITIDEYGRITLIRGHSGHYKPKMEHLLLFQKFLTDKIGPSAKKIEISAYEKS